MGNRPAPVIDIGTFRGHDFIITFAATAATVSFQSKVEEFLEEYLVSETGPVPFGGRERELADLDSWLIDEQASSRLLLTAPAGRGKSALLVHWVTSLHVRNFTNNSKRGWCVAFVPISIRKSTNLPSVFYQALAKRLADIAGEELSAPLTDAGAYYADQAGRLLRQLAKTDHRVLVVMDGLDEALGGRFDAGFVPRLGNPKLKILLSARRQENDVDASGWLGRLGWDVGVRVKTFELDRLNANETADVLWKMGVPLDVLSKQRPIVDRLTYLSEGEPLLLRYYAEDLSKKGEGAAHLTIADLNSMTPGFTAYFKRWIDDQEKAWKEENLDIDRHTVDGTLAVLACAEGPLTRDDLAHLVHTVHGCPQILSTQRLIDPLRRFVIGDPRAESGYVLSHPKIGSHLRTSYLLAETVQKTQQGFAAWGRETVINLNSGRLSPEKAPSYLLQYYTEHLKKVGAPAEDFQALVEDGWRRAWEAYEGGFQGFSRDVQLVRNRLQNLAERNPDWLRKPGVGLGGQIRCVLCLSSIQSIGINVPPILLSEAVRNKKISAKQALYLAELKDVLGRAKTLAALAPHLPAELLADALSAAKTIGDEQYRAAALAALAPHLPAEQQQEVLADALRDAKAIGDEQYRAAALAALAPHLPAEQQQEVLADALRDAKAIGDEQYRAAALAALAPHLPAELLADALSAAKTIGGEQYRAAALAALAPHLPAEQQQEVLADALSAAKTIGGEQYRAAALAALAPHLPAELLADALRAAMAIGGDRARADALVALAPHLPAEQQQEVLADALRDAKAIGDEHIRAAALAALAPHLPAELLADALRDAKAIGDEGARAKAIAALAPHLPAELLADALRAAKTIGDEHTRADALAALAPHLPAELLADALRDAKAIGDEGARAKAIAALAPHLPAELLADALRAAKAIGDEHIRAAALAALAPHLPAELLADALRDAKAIGDEGARAKAIAALAPHLPAELLADALRAAKAIGEEWYRAAALAALAPHLPAELLADALSAAKTIGGDRVRADALVALAPHLPAEQQQEVLATALSAAKAIGGEGARANALVTCALHLPDKLKASAVDAMLEALARSSRRVALHYLRSAGLVLANVGGRIAARETAAAIRDVASWWP